MLFGISCNPSSQNTIPHEESSLEHKDSSGIFIKVLGVAQDAGYPQAGCKKSCCKAAWQDSKIGKKVVSIAILDFDTGEEWLFEATPDFKDQLQSLNKFAGKPVNSLPEGIFLTHAHIGHYTGLIHLGREVMGSKKQKVYCMPKMAEFLSSNGPWSQLVELENISLNVLKAEAFIPLNANIKVEAFVVPHRDEFSETVGYKIEANNKKVIFIPDIDKWSKWDKRLEDVVLESDYLFLDATFYQNGEIPGRDMSEIPHPFVKETMNLLEDLTLEQKRKIIFIHFNHTNPLLNEKSEAYSFVKEKGFRIAVEGESIKLD